MRRRRIILIVLVVVAAAAGLWAAAAKREAPMEGPAGRLPETDRGRLDGPGLTWADPVEVDAGPGRVGPWRMNRSDWRYVDDPTVALDREGEAVVAWVDQARKDVLLRRYGPDGAPMWDEPVNVSRTPEVFSWLPRIAVDPDHPERVYALWQEIVFSGGTHGGEAYFARSTDGGRTFGAPIDLSNTTAGVGKGRIGPDRWHNGSLALAVGPEGTVHLAWAVADDPAADLRYAVSGDGGGSFAEAAIVPGTADPAYRVNGSLQGLLMDKLSVNTGGDVAVVNSGFEPGRRSRVVLIRGRGIRR